MFKGLKSGKFAKPILVGHNITGFDNKFLEKMFEYGNKNLWDVVDKNVEDTMYLSRYKWYDDSIANFQLTTCCNKAGVELIQAHRALPDTKATARLFIEHIKSLRSQGSVQETKKVRETFKF
jgi:DNA polymerase III alpha subunit (gram-positive type)